TGGYFASTGVDTGPLHALANGVDGGNGVFRVGAGGGFPNQTYNSANYWVDVVFSTTAQDNTPPTLSAQTPTPGASAVPPNSTVTATFSEPVQASTISFVLKDAANNVVAASVSYNATTGVATLIPSSALVLNTTYTATVSGAADQSGNQMTA